MRRRDFLKSTASATLFLSAPWGARRAIAEQDDHTLWLTFDATGGWDPTMSIDPKGGEPHSSYYDTEHILSVPGTNITYAPREVVGGVPQPFMVGPTDAREDFFQRYGNDLVLIRGIDTQTNSHDVGPRHTWSGNLRDGRPALSALVAAIHEDTIGGALPMTLLSTGGFDFTAGLLPPARVGSVNTLLDLSLPYRVNPRSQSNTARYFHPDVEAKVRAAQAQRHARLTTPDSLPFVHDMLDKLARARATEPAFAAINTEFQALPDLSPEEAANPLIAKVQVALAAMRAGVCVAANLNSGGFDTHQNHDQNHRDRFQTYIDAIDFAVRTLEQLGLKDRAVILMGSDFGRTTYNLPIDDPSRGKDHWPITTMLAMGRGISGGRVIGQTDHGENDDGTHIKGVRAQPVKEVAGEVVVTSPDDPEGFILTPGYVHQALRALAGIDQHPYALRFPIEDLKVLSPLPLFS